MRARPGHSRGPNARSIKSVPRVSGRFVHRNVCGTSKIGRLSPNSFSVTGEFPTLTANGGPTGIAVGQDNALWFTESGLDKIGRITTGGTVSEYASPVTGLGLKGIAVAPDGSLWFCEPGTGLNPGRIGKLVY